MRLPAVTASAVAWALRSVADATHPGQWRHGAPGPVDRPRRVRGRSPLPVAVGAGNVEVSQRVADVCLRALAQAAPDRVGAAGQGTMNNLILGGRSGWVYYETIGGGQGARPGRSGMNGVHTAMTNTMDTPTEALERAHPVRVLRYRLRRDSGGAGRWQAAATVSTGLSRLLEPATCHSSPSDGASAPWGLAGGGPGAVGENWLWPAGDESRRVPLATR